MTREFRECLLCGQMRIWVAAHAHTASGECPRCGYLGWAAPSALSEETRKLYRDHPPLSRLLRTAAP